MKREIKFRKWHKELTDMTFWDGSKGSNNLFWHTLTKYPEMYILMQFTGLHDKNGKEIYEGDIVRGRYFIQRSFDPDASPAIAYFEGVISFAEGCFYVKGEHNQCSFSFTYPDYEMELIGNIYEN
jgi:uncharacterized phage protein (TIGR01671 family)